MFKKHISQTPLKVLSSLLAISLVVSFMPVSSAFADEENGSIQLNKRTQSDDVTVLTLSSNDSEQPTSLTASSLRTQYASTNVELKAGDVLTIGDTSSSAANWNIWNYSYECSDDAVWQRKYSTSSASQAGPITGYDSSGYQTSLVINESVEFIVYNGTVNLYYNWSWNKPAVKSSNGKKLDSPLKCDNSTFAITAGDKKQLPVTNSFSSIVTDYGDHKDFYDSVFESNNTDIAKIDSKGVVTGVAPGECEVKVKAGRCSISVPINVLPSKKTTKVVTGKYKDGAVNKDISKNANYSDSYFTAGSTKVQAELAKLSMLASAASYNKSYAQNLMKQCGFEYKYQKLKSTRKNNDHVSYIVGTRKIDDFTLVAVWVKGTSSDYEWVSNFNLGKGKTHKGFSLAESELNANVNSYLKSKGITGKTKWWVTGHSRGAAVANLYAKRLTSAHGKQNVYAYTFATPRVSTSAKKSGYENIKNYLNPGDFVTEVAPSKWGYKRYGQDITFTSKTKGAMASKFKSVTGKKYQGFGTEGKKSLVNAFLNYAGGSNVKAYYKKKVNGVAPVTFCQKGLGYTLAGEARGYAYALGIAGTNKNAKILLTKMIIDGKVNNKFAHAHCQASYLSWLDAMYK